MRWLAGFVLLSLFMGCAARRTSPKVPTNSQPANDSCVRNFHCEPGHWHIWRDKKGVHAFCDLTKADVECIPAKEGK